MFGEATGSIGKSTVSGGDGTYNPSWSSGPNATDVSASHDLRAKTGLKAGEYVLTVRDGAGAEAQHVFTVNQTERLFIHDGKVRNAPVKGKGDGYISASRVTGGTPPYTFEWTHEDGGEDIPIQIPLNRYDVDIVSTKYDLRPGTYILTVTDSVGAVATHKFKVREGPSKMYFEFGGHSNFFFPNS